MKNTQFFSLLFLIPGMFFSASCSIFPSPEAADSRYYDLSTPARLSIAGKNVFVLPFSSNSGERYKMAFRVGNDIHSSESYKWIMPPGSLLTKYFRLAFRSEPGAVQGKENVTLSGTVSLFESEKGEVLLGLTYRLRAKEKEFTRTILLREKMEKATPAAFASAMSRAAGKAAKSIAADIKKL